MTPGTPTPEGPRLVVPWLILGATVAALCLATAPYLSATSIVLPQQPMVTPAGRSIGAQTGLRSPTPFAMLPPRRSAPPSAADLPGRPPLPAPSQPRQPSLEIGALSAAALGFALGAALTVTGMNRLRPTPVALAATSSLFGNPFARRGVPRDIKATVAQLRESVQRALEARESRMDVELPLGAKFGVEAADDSVRGNALIERSDRELARLFVEMFQPIGDAVVAVFPDERQAAAARDKWGPSLGQVTTFASPTRTRGGGFSGPSKKAPPSADLSTAEVVLVVAPTPADFAAVQRLAAARGSGCCIVLLNARLHQAAFADAKQEAAIRAMFRPVYQLRPLLAKDGGVAGVEAILLHTYPEGWLIARKPAVGPPVVLLDAPTLPPPEEIRRLVEDTVPAVDAALSSLSSLFLGRPKS